MVKAQSDSTGLNLLTVSSLAVPTKTMRPCNPAWGVDPHTSLVEVRSFQITVPATTSAPIPDPESVGRLARVLLGRTAVGSSGGSGAINVEVGSCAAASTAPRATAASAMDLASGCK